MWQGWFQAQNMLDSRANVKFSDFGRSTNSAGDRWICDVGIASYECKDQVRHSFKQINYFVIQIRQVLLGLYVWETTLIETLTKMNANRWNCFCCLVLSYCDRRIWIELTKTGDKARNWMTMYQNWSTKDEIETSIRTFQSVRDEIENTFSTIEWKGDENGRENV